MKNKIGQYCIIDPGIEIGTDTEIGNYVEIRKGVKIGNNCYIDSMVCLTGDAVIGDNVSLRHGCGIGRNVVIGENTYISPRAIILSQNHKGEIAKLTKIGKNVFIGAGAYVFGGVEIGDGVIIGVASLIRKDCLTGVWFGIPAKCIRRTNLESRGNLICQ